MKILQSRSFERKVKKFSKQDKKSLDDQIRKIIDDPSIGSEKKAIYVEFMSTSSSFIRFNIFWLTDLLLKTWS